MPKHGLRNLLDTLFPVGEAKKKTSEMIERGLEALRAVRDARGFVTGNTRLVPSRLELRLAQARYDELAEMGAVRDIEYYFNDELMKDMTAAKMKTFGDHPVYVTIAADTALQTNEIYAAVLTPENDDAMPAPAGHTSEVFDRTSVLGEESIAAAGPHHDAPAAAPTLRLVVSEAGRVREVPLEGRRWIIGRRGTSGRDLAEGYRKVDVDLPTTVSREQVRLDLIGGDRLRIERIGKAPVLLHGGEELRAGENRLLPLGGTFVIDTVTLSVVARGDR
jgi:hypothetical protein